MITFEKGTRISGMLRQDAEGHYITNSIEPTKDGKDIISLHWLNGYRVEILIVEPFKKQF